MAAHALAAMESRPGGGKRTPAALLRWRRGALRALRRLTRPCRRGPPRSTTGSEGARRGALRRSLELREHRLQHLRGGLGERRRGLARRLGLDAELPEQDQHRVLTQSCRRNVPRASR
eukprot:1516771-Alexandrium_andersonii.AAC.1